MSNNDQGSNDKPNSNSANLSLPALTKQFSNQLGELDTLSTNSHKQYQSLVAVARNISDSLAKLNTIVHKSNLSLETLSSPETGLCSVKDSLSIIKQDFDSKLSTHLQNLEAFSCCLEKLKTLETFPSNFDQQISKLSEINDNLTAILKDEKKRIGLTDGLFKKVGEILGSHRDLLVEIKALVENLSNSNPQVNEKIDSFDKKLSQSTVTYNENLALVSNNLKLLAVYEKNIKETRLGVLVLTVATIILFVISGISLYFNYSLSLQLNNSVDSIKQEIQSMKGSPEPASSPTPNKTDKKQPK